MRSDCSLKVPYNPQRYACTLEVAAAQEHADKGIGENIFRVDTISGQTLLSMSVSREIIKRLTSEFAHATPAINIDGTVGVMFDDKFQHTNQAEAVALDQLVAEAISPDMLEDEPTAAVMLSEFRIRLLKSLELVEQAIATLPEP